MRWPIFTLLFLFSAIGHAQTENIDSVYRLFNQKLVIGNDSVLLSWIQQHHLNLNHRFQMPDRFYNYNALHKNTRLLFAFKANKHNRGICRVADYTF
jgi:hypothetical protein